MSGVNWSEAPEGAQYRANGLWWCHDKETDLLRFYVGDDSNISRYAGFGVVSITAYADYEPRPKEWPIDESRSDIIGQNGNTGEHYEQNEEELCNQRYVDAAKKIREALKAEIRAEDAQEVPQGNKYDQGKPMYNLLPPIAVNGMAEVLTYGANKYAPNNWRKVENAQERYQAALLRHAFAYLAGEVNDKESGLPHMAHVMACAAFLIELQKDK